MPRAPLHREGVAKAPAALAVDESVRERGVERRSLAQRVAAGRTLERLIRLMDMHFLHKPRAASHTEP
eukprot:10555443-Alexandrium_andersonii.AAC.1